MSNNRKPKVNNNKNPFTSSQPSQPKKFTGDIMNLMFNQNVVPLPVEKAKGNRKGNDVMWIYGDNNLYPNHLLKLYNNNPIHRGIIEGKINHIMGNGLKFANSDEKADFNVNEDDSITDLLRKVVEDYLIFSYYAIEVIFNGVGEPVQWNYIPASTIRTNKSRDKFFYCDDWELNSNQVIEFGKWNRNNNGDYTSKIYFYGGHSPSNKVYPEPEYSGALKSLQTYIDIIDFHSHNINNNFSPSSIITFHNGEPTPEMKETIERSITNSYTGSQGKKIIINFANEDSKPAEVTNISPSEWNEAYLSLNEQTLQNIISAHSLTSPLLCGVSVAWQLGANSEYKNSYKSFRKDYVFNRRREIVDSLNKLFKGVFNPIEIEDYDIFGDEIDPAVSAVMTIDEIRAKSGLPPLPNGQGNRLSKEVGTPTPATPTPPANFHKFSKEEIEEDELKFNSIAHFGSEAGEYMVLRRYAFNEELKFESDTKLTDYLIKSAPFAGQSLSSIQSKLDDEFTLQEIREEMAKLVNARLIPMSQLINSDDLRKAIKNSGVNNNNTSNLNRIEIRYSYEGHPIDEKTRPFCKKIQQANRLYSREDIEKMSEVLGFNIFSERGGLNCRHHWVKQSVVRIK